MADPKQLTIEAYASQGATDINDEASPYRGTDHWEETTLREGDRIAQIEYRDLSDPENAGANSRYFTSAEELERWTGPDGKVDIAGLSERLQVQA